MIAWDLERICTALAGALEARAAILDAEQATRGIDAEPELALHPILAEGLRAAGYAVLPEERYPAARARGRRSEGDRCDLVIVDPPSDAADIHLADPLLEGTLFAGRGVDPAEALWLEVKVVAQHALTPGGIAPNVAYASLLGRTVTEDVRRLTVDPGVRAGAIVLVLFTADARTARHDVDAWRAMVLEKGLWVAAPSVRGFAITDRLGNGWCAVAVCPVR